MDSNPDTASKHNVQTIPNLLVFRNGLKVGNIIGAMPETVLLNEINKFRQ